MRFSKIKDNDIANGFGITMSLWTQGCPHYCSGCFNMDTWDFDGGIEFSEENLNYILANIDKHNIKRDLSILGGEPLCPQNIDGVVKLCKKFKEKFPDKKIYLWTGYTMEMFDMTQIEILRYVDILVDGKFEEENKNLSIMLRGSTNQRVIDVKRTLVEDDVILYEVC